MRCEFCGKEMVDEYGPEKPVKYKGKSGKVREVWMVCDCKPERRLWGGWEEALGRSLNWAPLQVFYGISGPMGLVKEEA